MNPLILRFLISLVTLSGLAGAYFYWKDDIEDTLLAKIRLEALTQAMQHQVKAREQEGKLIIKLEKDKEGYRLLSKSLGDHIRSNVDEDSCLVKPLSDNDARVLNEVFKN